MKHVLEANNLSVHYNKTPVLWDISFQIPPGLMTAIVGPNGAGKSTLLKAALNMIKPFYGSIHYSHGEKIAYVPQKEVIDWDFPITAFEVVLMGKYEKLKLFRRTTSSDKKDVYDVLQRLGMSSYANRQISELSCGQQQRLFIARALIQNPNILLMDEPFAGIDIATEKILIDLFTQLKKVGKSVVIVHHDLTTLEKYFDWVLLLNKTVIGCGPVEEVMTRKNIHKAYGKTLDLLEEAHFLSRKQIEGLS